MNPIDEDDLEGFEMQLQSIQEYLEGFDESDAVSNFAYDKGFPTDGSFGGKLQCGFAKEKGQLKKDGSLRLLLQVIYEPYFNSLSNYNSSCKKNSVIFHIKNILTGIKNRLRSRVRI